MAVNSKSYTDVIFQGIKLYIEGVQIPFNTITVTSGVGVLPTATISVPPQAGLMDIARFYQPKVHIFFEDRQAARASDSDPQVYKLLFSGLISQVNYVKSKDGGAYASISFACTHRYSLMEECLIDYTGWITHPDMTNNKENTAVKMPAFNSEAGVITALQGIDLESTTEVPIGKEDKNGPISATNPEGAVTKIPPFLNEFLTRLQGIPGVLVNFWNQMKQASYAKAQIVNGQNINEGFVKMYEPLIEKGLQFFQRLGGHFPIEAKIQATKSATCPDNASKSKDILIPPNSYIPLLSTLQTTLAVDTVYSYLQTSGEFTTIYQIFTKYFQSFDYDILTLTSPAEAPIPPYINMESSFTDGVVASAASNTLTGTAVKTYAMDTIILPRLPFYFSPTCNVLFPGMYTSVSVTYDESNVPTRTDLRNTVMPVAQDPSANTYFRAPHSVREAIAAKSTKVDPTVPYSLLASMKSSFGAIGLYEQGRGVKVERRDLSGWIANYSKVNFEGVNDQFPSEGSPERLALEALRRGWETRYPYENTRTMNPYSTTEAGINAHHRLLFTTADYYYTQVYARSKMGSVQCPFNPYITPGYPMDILERSPNLPSFHALCTTVTHSISANSCVTSIGFTAAMTYSEINNYYIPFVNPFLSTTLGIAENPTLMNPDQEAYETADAFYKYTLGVNSIAPSDLVNMDTMQINMFKATPDGDWEGSSEGSVLGSNGGELNPMLTYEGNLSLVHRPIESMADIEERFTLKFIDMDPELYNSSVLKYTGKELADAQKFEIGQCQFLDYNTFFGEPVDQTKIPLKPSAPYFPVNQ